LITCSTIVIAAALVEIRVIAPGTLHAEGRSSANAATKSIDWCESISPADQTKTLVAAKKGKNQMATIEVSSHSSIANTPRGMDSWIARYRTRQRLSHDRERTEFGLHGLLPPQLETLDEQVVRAYEAYQRKQDDLERTSI